MQDLLKIIINEGYTVTFDTDPMTNHYRASIMDGKFLGHGVDPGMALGNLVQGILQDFQKGEEDAADGLPG